MSLLSWASQTRVVLYGAPGAFLDANFFEDELVVHVCG
jgi:hypothetical protein